MLPEPDRSIISLDQVEDKRLPMTPASVYEIKSAQHSDRKWIVKTIIGLWGDDCVVVRGKKFFPVDLPGFIAFSPKGERCGLVTYQIKDQICEITTLNSLRENKGIGSALVAAVRDEAKTEGCTKIVLITTNDNQLAIDFYKRKGFQLVAVHEGMVDKARLLKPSIPKYSNEGAVIKDELEFELCL